MSKTLKIVISGIIAAIIAYYVYSIILFISLGHHIEMKDYKRYLWIFKDSVKNDIDTIFFSGHEKKKDILYDYIYKNNYLISVWEFKDVGQAALNKLSINQNIYLDNIKFNTWEMFNKKSKYRPRITTKLGFSFNYLLNVNLDEGSRIIKTIDSAQYKGFYGTVNRMSFSDETGKHLVLLDFPRDQEPVLLLLYKTSQSFYVIFINSKDKQLDEGIINILNLPG